MKINSNDGSLIHEIGTITHLSQPLGIVDLAFHPTTGALYGVNVGGGLYTVDLATAQTSKVNLTIPYDVGGLAFAPDGELFVTTVAGVRKAENGTNIYGLLKISLGENPSWSLFEESFFEVPEHQDGLDYFSPILGGLGIGLDGTFYATFDSERDIFQRVLANDGYKWRIIGLLPESGTDIAFQHPVPIPGAAILLGSGLVALVFVKRRH